MLIFSEELKRNEYLILPAFTLALDGKNFTYLRQLYGDKKAFEYAREMLNFKSYFVSIPRVDMWPLIVNYDGYIEGEYFIWAAAIKAGHSKISFLKRSAPTSYMKYDLQWARSTFNNTLELEEEYSSILKQFAS